MFFILFFILKWAPVLARHEDWGRGEGSWFRKARQGLEVTFQAMARGEEACHCFLWIHVLQVQVQVQVWQGARRCCHSCHTPAGAHASTTFGTGYREMCEEVQGRLVRGIMGQ